MVRAGLPTKDAELQLNGENQTQLDQLIEYNSKVGAPLAPTLERFAKMLELRMQTLGELEVAAAGPIASTKLVMSLPLLVLIGTGISGIPIFRTVFSNSLVWLSLLLGLLLYAFGSRWTNRLLRASTPTKSDPGFRFELAAIGVSAGLPLKLACNYAELAPESVQLDANGIATAELLIETANQLRFEQNSADRRRIQKAAVSVLWPLGLTVLPAFVLLAIVPVGLALLTN